MVSVNKQLEQLRNFHQAVVNKTGNWRLQRQEFKPGNETARLRADLVMEEAEELAVALQSEDKAQMLKEVCDVLYVTFAIAALYDLPVEAAFDEVHANNMLKIATGTTGKNGKFCKAPNHPKVDLNWLLDKQKEIKQEQDQLEFRFYE